MSWGGPGGPHGEEPFSDEMIPTHIAAAQNNVNELARLIREGAELLASGTEETPLHAAARAGSNETITWLLVNKKASPGDQAKNKNTAVHYAVVYGHLETLKVGRVRMVEGE